MRRSLPTGHLTLLTPFALAVATACGGSGTSTTNPLDTRDPAPSSVETPPASPGNEAPPSSPGNEAPPSAGDSVGTGGARGIPLCMNPPNDVAPCVSCVESACASQLAPVVGACSAYLDCYATCDCSDTACISACGSSVTTTCETAAEGLLGCLTGSRCENACSSSVTVTFGSSDAGTTVSKTPAPGGGNCNTLSSCCANLPSTTKSECDSVVSLNIDSECSAELTNFQSEGICPQ